MTTTRSAALLRSAALVAALAVPLAASAQDVPSVENVYARPGYPTVAIYVIGQVATPGKWRVEDGAPLMDLLAAVRPVMAGPEREGITERVRVRLYRESGGARQLAVDSELETLLLGSQGVTPLRDGDLLQVNLEVTQRRRRMTFNEIAGLLGTVASLGAFVLSVVR
jgi:hypothetical protein